MSNKRIRADLGLLLCALIWGATFVVVKDALADVSVFVYIAVRFALSAAVMGIVFWRSLRGLDRKAIWAGAQIGFFLLGGYVFQTTGLKFTTPSKAAFITAAARGCSDDDSAAAAIARSSLSLTASGSTSRTMGLPSVSVPVLSRTM